MNKGPGTKAFAVLWLGQLVSNLGTQASLYGMGLLLFARHGRVSDFAAVAVVVQLARLAVLPLLGQYLADWPRRRTMLVANGIGGCVTAGLALLLLQGNPLPWLLLLTLLAVSAAAEAALVLTFSSLITTLVPAGAAQSRAAGLFASSDGLALTLAPFVGAALASLGGLRGLLLLDGLSFLWACLCARALVYAGCEVLFPAWLLAGMGPGRLGLALLVGAGGYGAGVLLWTWRKPSSPQTWLQRAAALQAWVLIGAGLVLFEHWLVIWWLGLLVFSACIPISLSALQCLWQQRVAEPDQPRCFALRLSLEWWARLAGFVGLAALVDGFIRPALGWTLWPTWLLESLGRGPGRPMAMGLGLAGWVLLLTLLRQAAGSGKRGNPCAF